MLGGVVMGPEPRSLFATEADLARAILGPKSLRQWRQIAAAWEMEGLPAIDPITGRRFWPAVEAWLHQHYGVNAQTIPTRPDGDEQWSKNR